MKKKYKKKFWVKISRKKFLTFFFKGNTRKYCFTDEHTYFVTYMISGGTSKTSLVVNV